MSFRRFATYIFKTWSSFTEAGTTERYHYNEQFSYLTSQPDGYTKGEGAPLLSSHESRSAIKIIFLFPPLFLVGVAERQQCCSVTLFLSPDFSLSLPHIRCGREPNRRRRRRGKRFHSILEPFFLFFFVCILFCAPIKTRIRLLPPLSTHGCPPLPVVQRAA